MTQKDSNIDTNIKEGKKETPPSIIISDEIYNQTENTKKQADLVTKFPEELKNIEGLAKKVIENEAMGLAVLEKASSEELNKLHKINKKSRLKFAKAMAKANQELANIVINQAKIEGGDAQLKVDELMKQRVDNYTEAVGAASENILASIGKGTGRFIKGIGSGFIKFISGAAVVITNAIWDIWYASWDKYNEYKNNRTKGY